MLTLTQKLLAVGGLAGALLGLPQVGFAEDACAPDRARLCQDARGPGVKMQCMQAHEAELSDACRAQRGMVRQVAMETRSDCRADASRLCQGVQPGGGRIRACLSAHATELSPACQAAEQKLEGLRASIRPGCHAEVTRLCPGVAPGQGRIVACLQAHQTELSPMCKQKLDQRLARRALRMSGPAQPVAPNQSL